MRLSSRLSLGLVMMAALGLGGCFNYSEPICSFSCGTGTAAANLCPSNYECRTDGYCHKVGTTESCGFSDASVAPDLSATLPEDLGPEGGTMNDQGPQSIDQSISDLSGLD